MRRLLTAAVIALGFLAAAGSPAAAQDAAGVRVRPDVPYLAAGRRETLDLYLPAQGAALRAAPAIVMIHGGGWVGEDKAQPREQAICRALARAGYVCASVNYRLGDGAWPTNLYDCKNAVRFLRVHAADYGIDPGRLAVLGCSSGGHLALMVGFTAGDPGLEPPGPYPGISSAVGAVVEMYGITDLLTRQETTPAGEPTGRPKDVNAPRVLGATRKADPALWRLASPVTHITPASPPVLIIHGLADATVDYGQAQELDRKLTAQGVPHELILLPGVGHQFDFTTGHGKPLPRDLTPVVLNFLSRYLAVGPTVAPRPQAPIVQSP
jgi:acetyl esterase/lipase